MAKQGEIDYLKNLGEAGARHAARKPWSDEHCPRYLMQMGAIMAMFPPKPARILDLGCGTGVPTAKVLAEAGHRVLGVDISEGMLEEARRKHRNVEFVLGDAEKLPFHSEYL